MKKLILLVIVGVLFIGCKDKETQKEESTTNASQNTIEGPDLTGFEYSLLGDSVVITKCTLAGQVIVPNVIENCLLYTSPSPRDQRGSGMPAWA